MDVAFGIILMLLGFVLIVGPSLFYRDEETKVQAWLENFWIKICDWKDASLTLQDKFARKYVALTSEIFSRNLGSRILSVQSITVCASWSLASFCLFFLAGTTIFAADHSSFLQIILICLVGVIVFTAAAISNSPIFRGNVLAFFVILLMMQFVGRFVVSDADLVRLPDSVDWEQMQSELVEETQGIQKLTDHQLREEYGFNQNEIEWLRNSSVEEIKESFSKNDLQRLMQLAVTLHPDYPKKGATDKLLTGSVLWLAIIAAVVSDLLFVVITRRLLRYCSTASALKILVFAIFNIFFSATFVAIPFIIGFMAPLRYEYKMCFAIVSGMNWTTMLLALSSILLAIVLLLHTYSWPVADRLIYKLASRGIEGRKKWMIAIGFVMLTAGSKIVGLGWVPFLKL